MVDRIYPTELNLNRANSSDTEAPFLDLNLCISNGRVSNKIYDKRDDFDFDIVDFPFLDGDVPRRTSYGIYISQLIRFARASSNLNDFNYRNNALTAKLLRQGCRYLKLRKTFSKFYRRHSALLEKYSVSLKTFLQQGISEPEFYGDLVYRFRKNVGKSNFSEQFRKLINRYKRFSYSLDIISLAPDPFFIFLFFLFLLFFLRGHNTCIACRIFVYFSPLARKKGSGNK